MRHMTFDPFAFLFASLIKNRVSVHHAKEVAELKLVRSNWKGRWASWLERFSGRFLVRKSCAIFGVTGEIANYERDLYQASAKIHTFPNGITLSEVEVLQDERSEFDIHVAFLCGTFSSWHGLDLLVEALEQPAKQDRLKIHLIGHIPDVLKATIEQHPAFQDHGTMEEKEYREILAKCDFSLGSLALFRKGLEEAATLKNREVLAMGLPILSGHVDTAFPDVFAYHRKISDISLHQMIEFGEKMKHFSRLTVRNEARQFIEKEMIMRDAVAFLEHLDHA
ncbi:hypothetical protein [Yoonia sp. F2084L]|uniref:hypothetical protein n=1 Tax=Yoonia sp. F2084L TaxID=2926419 RepID=UPI001FF16DDE|nr:hypothetical protein [Yoonia sp. F2084L]